MVVIIPILLLKFHTFKYIDNVYTYLPKVFVYHELKDHEILNQNAKIEESYTTCNKTSLNLRQHYNHPMNVFFKI